jgi:hypothetical protein
VYLTDGLGSNLEISKDIRHENSIEIINQGKNDLSYIIKDNANCKWSTQFIKSGHQHILHAQGMTVYLARETKSVFHYFR